MMGNKGTLNNEKRKLLVDTIVSRIVTQTPDKIPSDRDFTCVAEQIVTLFPREESKLYYRPYARPTDTCGNTGGILYNKFFSVRKGYGRRGLIEIPKRRKSTSSTTSSESTTNSSQSLGTVFRDAGEQDNQIVDEAITWLKTEIEPWNVVETKWRETAKYRLELLTSVSVKFETISDYADTYPCLKEANGYKLLTDDFDLEYADKADALFGGLYTCRERIIELARKPSSHFVKEVNDLIDSCGELSADRNSLALLLLPYVISPPPGKKIKSKPLLKPSVVEQRDAFLFHLKDEGDLVKAVDTRRAKLQESGLTLQPWIVYVGEDKLNPTKVFIIVDNIKYIVGSLFDAVNITYKIFHATQALYPYECENIWLALQLGFYKMTTKYDKSYTTVTKLLVDIGLQ
uniref:Uncharacterized protein n=1 Tax=Cacopsylla melanoneura TaxID=428564 RepID=A0A8D8PZN0_9HEMI